MSTVRILPFGQIKNATADVTSTSKIDHVSNIYTRATIEDPPMLVSAYSDGPIWLDRRPPVDDCAVSDMNALLPSPPGINQAIVVKDHSTFQVDPMRMSDHQIAPENHPPANLSDKKRVE
jgi:hypothetical protein